MTIPETLTLDCYYNNAIPSFQQARDAGLRAVIHKCSEGSWADPLYAKRKVEVTGLGMMWGAYHFGHIGNAVTQADYFLSLVGNDPSTLLCLDLERDLQGHIMPLVDAELFAARIKGKTGRLPVIYTAKWVMDIINPQGHLSPLFDCPLWVASYNTTPTLPVGWNTYKLWQYTNGQDGPQPHTLPGLGHNDLDVFNGTLDEMKAWWQGSGPVGPGNGDGNLQVELMTTTATVNVRKGAGTNYPVVYQLPANTDVKMITDNAIVANGYHWLERYTYRGLWIAREFLKSKNPLAGLRLGLHVSMRNYDHNRLLAMLRTMQANGRPCPGILLLGPDEISIGDIQSASPETIIVLRIYPGGGSDLTMTAQQYFAQYVDPFPGRSRIRYHQINNENNNTSIDAINWWYPQMLYAESRGYRLSIPTWPTGNPGDLNVWTQPHIHTFMRYIRDHGHLFALHEYYRNDADWELFRFADHAYPLLPTDLQTNMPLVVHTEWGQQGLRFMPREGLLSLFRTYQARLSQLPFRAIAMAWAVGDTGAIQPGSGSEDWTGDNFGENMEVLLQV